MQIKKNFCLLALFCVLAALVLSAPSQARHHGDRDIEGEVKVCNDSDYEIYVSIAGRNQGRVWKRSSETFKGIKMGSHKVTAEVGNERSNEWVNLSPSSPNGEVTFKNDDFPDMPERRHP